MNRGVNLRGGREVESGDCYLTNHNDYKFR
jgi:hypothetical protein